jgi:hypothetical protein
METTHQPVHDPFTGKPPQGMRMLFGCMGVDDKIRYCERLLDEGHEERIEATKHELKTANQNEWWYAGTLHYVTVMPNVVAWTRAELSRLLALRDSTRRPSRRKAKPKRR